MLEHPKFAVEAGIPARTAELARDSMRKGPSNAENLPIYITSETDATRAAVKNFLEASRALFPPAH
jgi:hypothetical protein